MNSVEMADKLADALRALTEECETNMDFGVTCMEREVLERANETLAQYERTQVERVSRQKSARNLFTRQHR